MEELIRKLLIKLVLIRLNYSPTIREIILMINISIIRLGAMLI